MEIEGFKVQVRSYWSVYTFTCHADTGIHLYMYTVYMCLNIKQKGTSFWSVLSVPFHLVNKLFWKQNEEDNTMSEVWYHIQRLYRESSITNVLRYCTM